MRTRTSRTGYIWALCALCSLVASFGTVSAAGAVSPREAVVEERDALASPLSLTADKSVSIEQAGLNPDAPTFLGCPLTVLPGGGGTSGNSRAPNPNFLSSRAVWLITATEAAANGLTSGSVPGAMGWHYSTAPSAAATGSLKVYLQNTADTTNLKSTDWTTAIAGMTLVHNSAASTLPATTTPFDITFAGGSPFTYTGGGVYAAFEWSWAGPVRTLTVVDCNTTLTNGLLGANGATSTPPATLAASSFRPLTRLTPAVGVANDASVDAVISYGSLAQPQVGPQAVQAVVTNKGTSAQVNLPVTFNLTGAETFTNVQTVASLAACGGQATVTFATFTPSAIGSDTVTVSVPADDFAGNNSRNRPLDETYSLYSYKHPGTTADGGVGLNGATGAFVAKFNTTVATKITAVNLEFPAATATAYRVAVYADSGSATPGAQLYVDAVDRTVPVAGPVTLPLTPVAVGPGNFFVGIQQTNTILAGLSFDAENPIRSGAFFFTTPLPVTTWTNFAPGNNFKLNIGINLQCTTAAACNDNNACTDDACDLVLGCTHTNNNANSCSDNNFCTANDACVNGVCLGGPPPPCDDGNACTANNCNAGTGLCENPAIVCNDNNTCTDDSCDTGTGCVYTANNSNTCTDNSLCTSPDVCLNGACVGQNAVVCPPDGNACTTEACNPATGLCETTNNTSACNDGNACTTGDACGPTLSENFDGVTIPNLPATWSSSVIGTGSPWTTVSTSSDTAPNSAFGVDGGTTADETLETPILAITSATAKLTFRNRWSFENATSFFDGGVLEIDIAGGGFLDILAAGGSFVSGGYTGVISTSFDNPLAGRSAWTGASPGYPAYTTTVVNLPAAAAGNTIQFRWRIGSDSSIGAVGQNIDTVLLRDGATNTCQPGTGTLDCNDNNPCTDDFCDSGAGCQHAFNIEPCNDNNACTTLDACNAGACAGTAVICDDFNPCTSNVCDPGLGCSFPPITAPPETQSVTAAANKTTYSWAPAAFATQYDVLRGSTGALPVGPGGGDESLTPCFGSVTGTTLIDTNLPAVGAGYWYLPRGRNSCGIGTYGFQGVHGVPGVERTSTTTCP